MSASELRTTMPPCVPAWGSLPSELRLTILELVARQTSGWGACASVCQEWQAILEKENFRQLRLRTSCLDKMEALGTLRQAELVRHISLIIDLKSCPIIRNILHAFREGMAVSDAITKLFSILSHWPVVDGADLTLEITFQSPIDKKCCLKKLSFGGGDEHDGHSTPNRSGDQPFHVFKNGWINEPKVYAPREMVLIRSKGFGSRCNGIWLPQVKAVTRFMFPRQCQREIDPQGLKPLIYALPRLKSLIYEPWQKWDSLAQKMVRDPGKIIHPTMPVYYAYC